MFVEHRFEVADRFQDHLHSLVPPFGYNGFGEALYYRTYSRIKDDGGQEDWADTVIRNINGTFSIRKDFYIKNRIPWNESHWQEYAKDFGTFLFGMKWMPPGRGLWAMGSQFVYERGSMALYNCAYTEMRSGLDFVDDVGWLMDSLMHGVGVGFGPLRTNLHFVRPAPGYEDHIILDTREAWVESVQRVILSFIQGRKLPRFDYSPIRGPGLPIKGFGGISSGPAALRYLHEKLTEECWAFLHGKRSEVEFKSNVANLVGCCVVAGNVRRSAEIAIAPVGDHTFLDLKNYKKYPHRAEYGWMSNNSATFDSDEDFDCLGEIARRVIHHGEPGIINLRNFKYGRIGRRKEKCRPDAATGINPCGEIPLEHREVCNLSETFPTMCETPDEWYKACEFATFYSSTVSLLPTHQPSTNRVVARNRRIGVGLVDYSGWIWKEGVHKVTRYLRNGYDVVTEANRAFNAEAGVPEALRKTCVKPGGTTPKLPGKTSGAGNPTFVHTIRRFRIQQDTPYHAVLVKANVPHEKDFYSMNTDVFEWPIIQGPAPPAEQISIWEQAFRIVMLQREWSDNAVSNTIYFRPKWKLVEHWKHAEATDVRRNVSELIGPNNTDNLVLKEQEQYVIEGTTKIVLKFMNQPVNFTPEMHVPSMRIDEAKVYEYDPTHEEDVIEAVLSMAIPHVKSLSLLPHTAKGVYKQMPEEGISEEEYEERLSRIREIDWSELTDSDGQDERYCEGGVCEVVRT